MSNFNQLQAKRRSIYALGKELPVSNDALVEIVEKAMKEAPSAFNLSLIHISEPTRPY